MAGSQVSPKILCYEWFCETSTFISKKVVQGAAKPIQWKELKKTKESNQWAQYLAHNKEIVTQIHRGDMATVDVTFPDTDIKQSCHPEKCLQSPMNNQKETEIKVGGMKTLRLNEHS